MIELRLGKRQGHAVIGHEHHHGVVRLTAVLECGQNFAHAIISAPHAGVVQRQFLAHIRIIKKETGDRHFVRLENTRRHMGILAATFWLAPERLVRVRDVDHQTKRFIGCLGLGDTGGGGDAIGFHILYVRLRPIGQGVEVGIPCIGLIGRGMTYLAADAGEVTGCFHEIYHVWPAGIFYLIKTLHLVVVRVEDRKHHVAAGHAITHRNMRVDKAQ